MGLGVGGWTTLSFILKQVAEAQHYFTLDKAVEVDGITLPAGTRVELDDANALRVAELPNDTTLALRGTMWRGRIEFAEPSHASNAAHGQITDGTLAVSAVIDGIPCGAGGRATFFWGGPLMECTLSQNTEATATVAGAVHRFACLAGDTIQMAGLRHGEAEGCRLAETNVFGEVTCAAGERVRVTNGNLSACTFAKSTRFGPLVLPTGTAGHLLRRAPEQF